MSHSTLLSTVLFLLIAIHAGKALGEAPGSRPMNVAVSPDGLTVLATSMGSNSITQAKWNGTTYVLTSIAVGAPSWGIVFVDANKVVVTHPTETVLSVLTRSGPSGSFSETDNIDLGEQFRYSTEVIHYPGVNAVFVANRGMPLNGQPSWTNVVYLVDIVGEQINAALPTEREPRALALSPGDQCRLFVGHVQGALGGYPLATNHPDADNRTGNLIGDGGSILVYDICPWLQPGPQMPMPDERIGVGSPVRGIAVTENSDGSYVIYFTSVGDNANSEDPEDNPAEFFGGREIPNVISALHYSFSNELQSVVHSVFDHQPDWTPETAFGNDGLPSVLPDKLVVRDVILGGQRTRELFITNSGSGTLSRTPLNADGSLDSIGVVSRTRVKLTRVNNVIAMLTPENVPFTKLAVISNGGAIKSHEDLSRTGQPKFTSNTRAIAYNPATDKIWVATQFDNELIQVTPQANSNTLARFTICATVGTAGERKETSSVSGAVSFFGRTTIPICHQKATSRRWETKPVRRAMLTGIWTAR